MLADVPFTTPHATSRLLVFVIIQEIQSNELSADQP
jgi:hypothetical protein